MASDETQALAGAILAELTASRTATIGELASALGVSRGEVSDALAILNERRRVRFAGNRGWRKRQPPI